jgi:hypothetical protein
LEEERRKEKETEEKLRCVFWEIVKDTEFKGKVVENCTSFEGS